MKKDLDGAEFACEVYGDRTACSVTVEGNSYDYFYINMSFISCKMVCIVM